MTTVASTEAALEAAAIPSALAIIGAMSTFVTNLGTDPSTVAAKVPGALAVLIGSVELQAPALLGSEMSAVTGVVQSAFAGWTAKLTAAAAAAATAAKA